MPRICAKWQLPGNEVASRCTGLTETIEIGEMLFVITLIWSVIAPHGGPYIGLCVFHRIFKCVVIYSTKAEAM